MNFKDRTKKWKRDFARNALYVSSAFFNVLPYSLVKVFMRIFMFIGFPLVVRQRKMAMESLRIAFGTEKSDEEIDRIARTCFENIGQGMVELIYFMAHPKMINEKVSFEGREHLDAALAAGNGVIAVSAHFGNFPLMLLRLAQAGYKTNAIIRPARDLEIEKYFFSLRSRLGLNTIYALPRKECVDNSLRVLRNNEILFIPLDQNFGSGGGVFVEFFGQKAATATGPVVFAKRTKAPILPMFVIRESGDQYKVIIEPPLALEVRADDEEETLVNVSKITRLIEKYIRRYPHEWGWMHRRWKTKEAQADAAAAGATKA